MNVRKRGLALLMCICMIFTLLPFSALADATGTVNALKKPGTPSQLKIEYWCTNQSVAAYGDSTKYETVEYDKDNSYTVRYEKISLNDNKLHFAASTDFAPASVSVTNSYKYGDNQTTQITFNYIFWQIRVQDKNNHQTGLRGANATDKGVQVLGIQKTDTGYVYYSVANPTTPVQITGNEHIVCYFKQVFASSEKGSITGSDWGWPAEPNGGQPDIANAFGDNLKVTYKIKLKGDNGAETELVSKDQYYNTNDGTIKNINITPAFGYEVYKYELRHADDNHKNKDVTLNENAQDLTADKTLNRNEGNLTVIYYLRQIPNPVLSFQWAGSDTPDNQVVPASKTYTRGASVPLTDIYADYKIDTTKVKTDEYTYTFKGWYKDTNTQEIINAPFTINGDTTLYGKWEKTANEYNVIYTVTGEAPEGFKPPDPETHAYNSTVNVATVGDYDGWTFSGWELANDSTNVPNYTKGDNSFTMPAGDVNLVGEWERTDTTYTIECYWGYDNQNRLPADTDGRVFNGKVGQKIKLIDPPTINGYIATASDVITLQADGNVLKVYYLKNVTITLGNATVTYDGKEHSVNTFSATTIDGDATDIMARYIYAYVAETNAGIYPVGVFYKTAEVNPLAATDEVPAAIALKVGDEIGGLYYVEQINDGNLTINRAKVTVTADDKSKFVGEKDPEFTTVIKGLINGEDIISFTIVREKGETPGEYKIIPDGDREQGNYEVTFNNGTLTINRRPMPPVNPPIMDEITVEITGSSDSVVYDGTEHSVKGYTVKISDPRYTEKDFTFTGKAEASGVNAGTYEMGLKAEQFKNTNARFTNVKFIIKADGVLTITPKDLTITAGSKTEYGPTPVTCDEWTVSGLAAGDKVESVKITGIQSVPGSSPNVPSDAVIKNAKGEDVTKNYAIKYVNGTLTMLEVLNKEDHFNYIIGTPEGLSLPTANVTRAEVATIFFRLMTDDARAKFDSLDNNFSDVAKGKWYNRAISTLANAGIIKGDPAGTYRPGDPITRAEMAAIIARFGDFKEGGKTFSDISGHWAQKYIELAASNGWINGNPDGTFKPNNNITRAETVAMINRVLDRQTESNDDLLPVSQMTNWSDNMDTAKWYYRDMQEATNNHKAERVGDSIYEKWTEKLPDIDWASYQI